jgi:hypothetical protein
MKIAEMRHMNEIEANFLLNENEYLGTITLKAPLQQAIYTNVRALHLLYHQQVNSSSSSA